jgi:formylglycine-generating enzyme
MCRNLQALMLTAIIAAFAADARAVVTIAWSRVGNPDNAADPTIMNDGTSGYGSVGYSYRIATYDVTNSQYADFLNAKDPTGANILGLWNSNLADASFGGISLNLGNLPGSRYTLISGAQNHPVNFVTWYDTIRFANWINNGQGNGDTESGAYTLLHDGSPTPTPTPSNGLSITRNAGATVFLPSENEWYKAAFYDPRTTAQGGPPSDSHYWLYPTSSNTVPTASGPTALPNHANFSPGGPGNLTDVGAYTGTTSPYGAFDMGGNVWQWNEASTSGSFRGVRGSSYFGNLLGMQDLTRALGGIPTVETSEFGFRVASTIPEPSTAVLAVIACGTLWWWRKRFK